MIFLDFPDDTSLSGSEPSESGFETQQHKADWLGIIPVLPRPRHGGPVPQQPALGPGENLRGAADPDKPGPEPQQAGEDHQPDLHRPGVPRVPGSDPESALRARKFFFRASAQIEGAQT